MERTDGFATRAAIRILRQALHGIREMVQRSSPLDSEELRKSTNTPSGRLHWFGCLRLVQKGRSAVTNVSAPAYKAVALLVGGPGSTPDIILEVTEHPTGGNIHSPVRPLPKKEEQPK